MDCETLQIKLFEITIYDTGLLGMTFYPKHISLIKMMMGTIINSDAQTNEVLDQCEGNVVIIIVIICFTLLKSVL